MQNQRVRYVKCGWLATVLIASLSLTACTDSSPALETSTCEVREYLEQDLDLINALGRHGRSGTNFTAFHGSISPWMIKGFVERHDQFTFRLNVSPVKSIEKLDKDTSFLIIYAPPDLKRKTLLSQYFDGKHRLIDFNEACPIYVGERNGFFALATFRSKATRKNKADVFECNVVSTLAYFGLPNDELSQYQDFITVPYPDVFPNDYKYKDGKISAYLSEYTGCEKPQRAAELSKMITQAVSGDVKAQANLGLYYGLGEIVEKDDIRAAKWFKKAAEQGDLESQLNLGLSYRSGRGVPQDYIKSYVWTSFAATQGDDYAKYSIRELEKEMTESDISEAKEIAIFCYENNFKNCD